MARKGLTKDPQKHFLELEETWLICILTKVTQIPRGLTIDVSKFAPGFVLQMNFSFSNVESIRGFTLTFVDMCSATSYLFGFPSIIKWTTIDILKLLATISKNQEKTVAFIQVYEYWALERSSKFMKTCHRMNITVQTTGGYASSFNGKRETPNNKQANITRGILLKSSNRQEFYFFPYQYAIWISRRTENMFCGNFPYLLWYG